MCAINGFNFSDDTLLLKMNDVTNHRGPDASGTFSDKNISLGHNRLSIIDLSASSNQPMYGDNDNLVLVFNGEIYNYKELRSELSASYEFISKGDSEVILAAYKTWGKECVKKFNGIFAFAIWDKTTKELYIARDRVGVKPLYYYWEKGTLIFSSEIKAILEHPVIRELNMRAFHNYMRVGYVPAPDTMFKRISKLPPAHSLTLKGEDLTRTQYWNEAYTGGGDHTKSEYTKEVQSAIEKAVSRQLVSDKPVGIFLSGGVDSSIILDIASSQHNNIDVFSSGFSLGNKEVEAQYNADYELAKKTAQIYGVKHHAVMVNPSDVVSRFQKCVWHMDEPVSNPTIISTDVLSEYAKDTVDVVLGGDGGDELFGGYERYRLSYMSSTYQKYVPKIMRNQLVLNEKFKKLNIASGVDRFALFMFQKDPILSRVLRDTFYSKGAARDFFREHFFQGGDTSVEHQLMNTDLQSWMVDESLLRTDHITMAHALESRVPFLDNEVVSLAKEIPLSFKLDSFSTKKILREAFIDRIPKYLHNQPKRGWFSPGAKWLRDDKVYAMFSEILSPSYYRETEDMFQWDEIQSILERHRDSKEYNVNILWALATFQVWARRYNVVLPD